MLNIYVQIIDKWINMEHHFLNEGHAKVKL